MTEKMKTFLHIGCGSKKKDQTTQGFNSDLWREVRLDIDKNNNPDVIGSITNMSAITSASMDAIFSSHTIEHLYPHEVPIACKEFYRVLTPHGFLVITCPDLQAIWALVANNKLLEPIYISPAGPIAPLDILFGHRASLAQGNIFMAHRCGFTHEVLSQVLRSAGFLQTATLLQARPHYNIWCLATKNSIEKIALQALAAEHFPLS